MSTTLLETATVENLCQFCHQGTKVYYLYRYERGENRFQVDYTYGCLSFEEDVTIFTGNLEKLRKMLRELNITKIERKRMYNAAYVSLHDDQQSSDSDDDDDQQSFDSD